MLRCFVLGAVLFLLTACASEQLNFNTLDIANSVGDVYTRQALLNLSKFIDNPHSVPSFIDLSAGTVQTSNSVTPSIGTPLSRSLTSGPTGALTSGMVAGSTFTISATDNWQQNWNVGPVNDANILRNFQALYRNAIGFPDANLGHEYRTPWTMKNGKPTPDAFASQYPQCVKCSDGINPKLKRGWLYWDGADSWKRLPNEELVDLGHFGSHELYMTKADYKAGVLSDFVLFMLPVAEPTDATKQGGPGGNHARTPAFAPQSLGIQPR
jgi:hypothetical protein